TITLPTNSTTMNGSGSDPDGGNVTFAWTQQSGPNTAALSNENTDDLTAGNLVEGTYVFRLTVTDDENDTAFDEVSVIVNPEPNTDPPLANAGTDQNITLPTNSIVLNGSGSDPDGGNVTFAWTQTSGPNAASLSGDTTPDLTASNLIEGTYIFRLTVTDDESDTTFDEVSVTVALEASTDPPLADAGPDQNIALPTNSITLNGSGSDPDGGNVSFQWTQTSGPNTAGLSGATTADLTAGNLIEGTYIFRLTVTDNENDITFDEVSVTVGPDANTDLPLADAGTDQNVTLPTDFLTLNGSGSDPDGGDVTFQWAQESGPNTATLSDENTDDLTASNLVEGAYIFRLTVTDDETDSAFDEVRVTVAPEGSTNQAPVAIIEATPITGNAPLDVVFIGSNSTDDMAVVEYSWDFGNGATSTDADPAYTFTTAGVFTVELTVTDSEGLTNSASVNITVTELSGEETGISLEVNPSKDGVAKLILLNQPENVAITEIYVHDFTGRFVETFDVRQIASGDDSYEIPVAMLRDGMYYISVKTSNGEQLAINLLVRN
ncbi:MAG: PKD domain-containing protein, partial [Aurantibacter sp.]